MNQFLHTLPHWEHIPLPEQFTYPFHYTPHPLCVKATEAVQAYLQSRTEWHDELQKGKMFGVLVVKNTQGQISFLAAFSGNLAGSNHHDYFVPPVYDLLDPNGYFKQEEARISALSTVILTTEGRKNLNTATLPCHPDDQREEGSRVHKVDATPTNKTSPYPLHKGDSLCTPLLRGGRGCVKEQPPVCISHTPSPSQEGNRDINTLKDQRKQRSIALQQWIFRQFRLLNAKGEEKDIEQIFEETAHRNPPAGTGECAAPKLLQYAYQQGLQPLAMAEFWWGDSPKGEIRRHGNYYPACRHKCEPILNFMLQGLDVEPNPLLTSVTDATQLETVYEDEYLLVVNKPAGMLSVPGKTGQASVLSTLQERYPDATGPILVHRLDMDTSGLLLAAKNKDTHALLQKQFEGRTVKKRYIALLDGIPQDKAPKGFIRLPMRPDYDNRPLQMVCFEYGKAAVTRYVILNAVKDLGNTHDVHPTNGTSPYPLHKGDGVYGHPPCEGGQGDVPAEEEKGDVNPAWKKHPHGEHTHQETTRIAYYPETGRTHQLRVHSAHPDGMNCPIKGDRLYGQPADRLYLHAEMLEFRHPVTDQRMHITKEAPF